MQVMDFTGMPAIIAARQSQLADGQTGWDTQDEDSQEWAEAHGVSVVATVTDAKSGTKSLWERPNIRPYVIQPDLMSTYRLIIAAKQDRLSRERWQDEARLRLWAEDHGKILIIVDRNMMWPPESEDDVKAWNDGADQSRREWRATSRRYRRMQRKLRESGYLVGRPPWGYRSACECCGAPVCTACEKKRCPHHKYLVPTPDGRKYIPVIFGKVIDGESLRAIAAWLTAEGVPTATGKTRWNEGFLGNRLIKNPVYYGVRRNGGQLETEALVSVSVWQEANAALRSRVRPGRGTSVREKALLAPVCGLCRGVIRDGCPSGESPMYRVYGGYGAARQPYYRCTGHGPQRKGCGFMVPVTVGDAEARAEMLADDDPDVDDQEHHDEYPEPKWHKERRFDPGDDKTDEIEKLREKAMDAYRQRDMARFEELDGQAKALEKDNEDRKKPYYYWDVTGQRETDYFAALDRSQQREYFLTKKVILYRDGAEIIDPGEIEVDDPWV
jgi:hypothetical protein